MKEWPLQIVNIENISLLKVELSNDKLMLNIY